jgi:hypothetical protein
MMGWSFFLVLILQMIANDSQAKIRGRMRSRLISAAGKDFWQDAQDF